MIDYNTTRTNYNSNRLLRQIGQSNIYNQDFQKLIAVVLFEVLEDKLSTTGTKYRTNIVRTTFSKTHKVRYIYSYKKGTES